MIYVITRPKEKKVIAAISIGCGKYKNTVAIDNMEQIAPITRKEAAEYLVRFRNSGYRIKSAYQ